MKSLDIFTKLNMESLMSPKFKSRVEQFYYDHMTGSQPDLVTRQSSENETDHLKVHEVRKRAHSGDGRKGFFTFDSADIKFHANLRKTGNETLKIEPKISFQLCKMF